MGLEEIYTSLLDAVSSGDVMAVKDSIPAGFDFKDFDHEQMKTLVLAACVRKTEVLKLLIERGIHLNSVNSYWQTILLCAINDGHYQEALTLIDAGADVELRDYNGDDALMCSVRRGVIGIVRKLLLRGVNVNNFDSDGNIPLGLAYTIGQTEVVKTFIEAGYYDSRIDFHDNTLLILASRSCDIALIHSLVQANANINFQNTNGFTALISAVQHQHFDVVRILTQAGSSLDLVNKYDDTALTVACRDGLLHIVTFLLDCGANIEEGGWKRITPLMQASFHGQLDVVHELLQRGANVNATNIDGETALSCLNHARHGLVTDVCQMLADHGADINICDCHQMSPFVKAIVNGNTNFVRILIALGAGIESVISCRRFRRAETPIIIASRLGRADTVSCLLKHGADANAKDKLGNTALTLAAARRDDHAASIIQLLVEAGADIEHVDSNGMTPLMIVSSGGSQSAVVHLLENGACVNTRHYLSDESALCYATAQGFHGIVQKLMDAGAEVRDELHVAIKTGAKDVVRTLVLNGVLPTPALKCGGKSLIPKSSKSPLFTSLLCNNVSIARYLDSIWFFNQYDIHELPQNKYIHIQLEQATQQGKSWECSDLFNHISRQPRRLAILSFVVVSSAVGFHEGRAHRVSQLKLPSLFKKRLIYQSEDAKLPVEEWGKLDSV